MTTALVPPVVKRRPSAVWRVVRLQLIAPSVFIGIPWLIVGSAWVVSMVIGLLALRSGDGIGDGMRYSWAVLSPQWYLAIVGVQAIALTFPYALGLGSTRRDYWLGTMTVFGLVTVANSAAFASLAQLEKATGGWWIDIRMFDALWYGLEGWWVDFYTSVALQAFVLVLGAVSATLYLRWKMRGMVVAGLGVAALLLAVATLITLTDSLTTVLAWFERIGLTGGFSLLLALAALLAVVGYLLIRRATPRG